MPIPSVDLHDVLSAYLPARVSHAAAVLPARVHVISASYGAGHDSAAAELARRLRAAGHQVVVWDVVEMFPMGLGRLARWLYLKQLALLPRSWGAMLDRLQPGTHAFEVGTTAMRLAAPQIVRLAEAGADLFVSTHPFASQVLGWLRGTGRIRVPAVTYLVDASVHPLWVHPDVDAHIALHDGAADETRRLGGRVVQVDPLVPAAYDAHELLSTDARSDVRRELGLGADDRLALVMGGSLGLGELSETAHDVRASGLAVPVVVCGRNELLRARLAHVPGVIALGWRDDLPALIQSADCVIANAGGFTCWESLAAGTPVITARAMPGHGSTNAAALDRAGLAPWVHTPAQLSAALATVLLPAPVLAG